MSSFPRQGRPPHVKPDGPLTSDGKPSGFYTTVKGQQFSFRMGEDGRLRRVGPRGGEAEDAAYARTVVERYINEGSREPDPGGEVTD